jgi:hypothetical protein
VPRYGKRVRWAVALAVMAMAILPASAGANELLGDPGFESSTGTPPFSPSWVEADSVFGSPICSASFCGTDGGSHAPHSGSRWVWFGATGNPTHTASVQQTVTIPSGNTPVSASWWVWVGAGGEGDETLTVTFDGVTKATYTTANAGVYMHTSVDVSAAADGGTHTLRFAYVNSGGNDGNMNVDDASIFNSPVPAVPTGLAVTPASGSNDNNPKVKGTADVNTATVQLYTDAACSTTIGEATDAATFNGAGIPVSVTDNSSTDFYAKATGPGGTSACSTSTVHYNEVTPPAPAAPTALTVSPASGSNDNAPLISGTTGANTDTVQLYTDSSCTTAIGSSTAFGTFNSPGIQVNVADNSSTDFYAIASGPGGDSPCSTATVHYSEVTPAPVAPTSLVVSPDSGSDENNPTISGTTGADTDTVQLYTDSACTTPIGSSTAVGTFNSPGIQVNVADNSSSDFYAIATGPGGDSPCSTDTVHYNELTAPVAPTDLAVTPVSGSNNNSPKIAGTVDANTATVQLYTDDTCTTAIGTPSPAATFTGTGIPVTVADNSSTDFYATATGPGGTSPCSTSTVHYTEVTPPPGGGGGGAPTPGATGQRAAALKKCKKKKSKAARTKCKKRALKLPV